MSLSKKGKSLRPISMDDYTFTEVISRALREAAEKEGLTIKTVANWTDASERTVKNWFSGRYGPSGEHLMVLMRHCDGVMVALMSMAGRRSILLSARLEEIERRLVLALKEIYELKIESNQS